MTAQALRQTYGDVAGHFDGQADRYDLGCKKVDWTGPQVLIHRLKLWTPIDRPLKVLDFGTGTGLVGGELKSANPQTDVTGIDCSPKMIQQALASGRVDRGLVGGVDLLGTFSDASFDAVISSGVLDFLPPEDVELLSADIARVLRPGGHFALTYEPVGTEGDGVKTLQHDPATLRAYFERRGAVILDQGTAEGIYNNFKNGAPVTNEFIIGSV